MRGSHFQLSTPQVSELLGHSGTPAHMPPRTAPPVFREAPQNKAGTGLRHEFLHVLVQTSTLRTHDEGDAVRIPWMSKERPLGENARTERGKVPN